MLELETPSSQPDEPIIDIHQHTNYSGRTDEQLLYHQKAMGVSLTLLLPAGSVVNRPSTHDGKTNGLMAKCGGNDTCVKIAHDHPGEYRFYANEVPDLPQARAVLTKYLKMGAVGIGEQKFNVPCDSPPIELVAEVAGDFGVPVLIHFQEGMFNEGFPNFHHILEKFPKVRFIGHARIVLVLRRQELHRRAGPLPARQGDGRRNHRPLSDGLSQHVRRHFRRLRAELSGPRRGTCPRISRPSSRQNPFRQRLQRHRRARADLPGMDDDSHPQARVAR